MGSVTISQAEYQNLLGDSAFLEALRAAGVDNWEGFDEAIRIFKEGDLDD